MKSSMQIVRLILSFTLIFGITGAESFSQRCGKKKLCEKEYYEDYDYRSQSSSAVLAPGDTARTNIVVYSRNQFRVLLCNDPELGDVNFKIYHPSRKTRKVVDKIDKTEEEINIYKKDENGELIQKIDDWDGSPMFDDMGNPVYVIDRTETKIAYDTVWRTEEYHDEELLFDSENQDESPKYYDETVQKTKRLIIEVIVPDDEESESGELLEGCVNVNVGRKSIRGSKSFQRR